MRRAYVTYLGILIWLTCASAGAQSLTAPGAWEVEFHGGGFSSSLPSSGTTALPAAAPSGTPTTSRQVPSWYFADGSVQLNQFLALQSRGTVTALTPLDTMLQGRVLDRQTDATFGARVAWRFARRFSAELTVDSLRGELALTPDTTAALEAASASFITAFNALFSTPLIASRTVNSTPTITERGGSQIATTGALLFDVLPGARIAPYVTAGAGGVSTSGTTQSATVTGSYQFSLNIPPQLPIPPQTFAQTDTVTVRSSIDSGMLWMLGGGARYMLSNRWGVRVDVRDYIRSSTITTLLDAAPTTPPSSFGTLTFLAPTAPALVFSGLPQIPSTLSTALDDFETFSASGTEHQVSMTAGVVLKF